MAKLLLLTFCLTFSITAQQTKSARVSDDVSAVSKLNNGVESKKNSMTASASITHNWITVDSMANSFGTAASYLNPLVYDPYSKTLALVHRSVPSIIGSGALYYNVSFDYGETWSRIGVPVNSGTQPNLMARYPDMLLHNPLKSSSRFDVDAKFFWPALNNSGFGFDLIGIAQDRPAGAGVPQSRLIDDDGKYGRIQSVWNADGQPWTFAIADYNDTPAFHPDWKAKLFRIKDPETIDAFVPRIFSDTTISDMSIIGGDAYLNTMYIAAFIKPDTNRAPQPYMKSGFYPAVSRSTDQGFTWSDWEIIDFRTIPGLTQYDRLFDFRKDRLQVSYCGDMIIDRNEIPHLVICVTDTNTSLGKMDGNHGTNSIIELFKSGSEWMGKTIFSGIQDSLFARYSVSGADPAIGQMGPSPKLATDKKRSAFVCQWAAAKVNTDTICDIFMSSKWMYSEWRYIWNITETPFKNENCAHLAKYVLEDNYSGYAFSLFSYEKGNLTSVYNSSATANIYVARIPLPSFVDPPVDPPVPPVPQFYFKAPITVSDAAGNHTTLQIGSASSATSSLDPGLGEASLEPVYSNNVFDARFRLTLNPVVYTLKDFRPKDRQYQWLLTAQPGNGSYPITVSWDTMALQSGNFTIADTLSGSIINVSMNRRNSVQITSPSIKALRITGDPIPALSEEFKTVRKQIEIFQNYPNPFNSWTNIRYNLPHTVHVSIKIYNQIAELVTTLANEEQCQGPHSVKWHADSAPSGVYFCEFTGGGFRSVQKITLIK